MRRELLVSLIGVVLLAAAGFAYVATRPKVEDPTAKPAPVTTQPEDPSAQLQQEPTSTGSTNSLLNETLTDYRDDYLSSTKGARILYFTAADCAACRQLEQSVQTGTVPADVTILKVDTAARADVAQRYNAAAGILVRVDDTGTEVKRFDAAANPSAEAAVQALR